MSNQTAQREREQRDRAAEHRKREPERVPTRAGLRAITPAPMTPEQVADLVERARANTTQAIIDAAQLATARREIRRRIKQRSNGVLPEQLRDRSRPIERLDDATHQAMEAIDRLPYLAPYGQR